LILNTKLTFNELIRILLKNPPTTVMRIVRIDTCCKLSSDLLKCLEEYLSRVKGDYSRVLFGRKGSLKSEIYAKVKEILQKCRSYSSDNVLHVEPVNDEVCLGIMKYDEDKFYKLRDKVITMKIESKL